MPHTRTHTRARSQIPSFDAPNHSPEDDHSFSGTSPETFSFLEIGSPKMSKKASEKPILLLNCLFLHSVIKKMKQCSSECQHLDFKETKK